MNWDNVKGRTIIDVKEVPHAIGYPEITELYLTLSGRSKGGKRDILVVQASRVRYDQFDIGSPILKIDLQEG